MTSAGRTTKYAVTATSTAANVMSKSRFDWKCSNLLFSWSRIEKKIVESPTYDLCIAAADGASPLSKLHPVSNTDNN